MNNMISFENLTSALTKNVDSSTSMSDVAFLKFHSKDGGTWSVDGVDLGPDDRLIVDPRTIMHGWMCWGVSLGGEPRKVLVNANVEGRPEKPEDLEGFRPWAKAWGVGMVLDGEPCWIEANTWGWEKQYQAFILEGLIPQLKANGPCAPVVSLINNVKPDKNGNLYPIIKVIEWGGVDLLEGPKEEPEPTGKRRRAA